MRLWLKDLREQAGLSQRQLGELLGISQNYYSQIEMGTRQETLKLPLMVKITEIFNIPYRQGMLREEILPALNIGRSLYHVICNDVFCFATGVAMGLGLVPPKH